jgi:hypothetical protein
VCCCSRHQKLIGFEFLEAKENHLLLRCECEFRNNKFVICR